MWIKGREYFNVNKWASIFNKDYGDKGIEVSPRDIHTLFQHFKIPMIKDPYNQAIKLYPVDTVTRYRQMERSKEFLSALYNLSQYGDINGFIEPNNDDNALSYKNNENDMNSYSDYLINQKYQFESRKKIKISEESYTRLFEGAEYNKYGNGVNLHINTKSDDNSNKEVDTRVFGTKNDILYGDNTLHGKNLNLYDTIKSAQERVKTYQSIINYAENNFSGDIYNPSQQIMQNVKSFVDANDKAGLINYAQTALERAERIITNNQEMINRLEDKNDNDVSARYSKLKVQGTNVNVIALFMMRDFNFSDAIKHGKLRQNGLTDRLLNIDKNDRQREQGLGKGVKPYKKIDVKYDNKFDFDIANNFSYSDSKDHYRKQYQSKDEYSSVNQFLDKSIIYAKYALSKEHFTPDYIVSVPSSSSFNEYYCNNLSNKLGVPYVKEFFKRNLINVKMDEDLLRRDGIDEKDIFALKNTIIKTVYGEISTYAKQPIENFISNYQDILSKISIIKMSRDKADISLVNDILSIYIFNSLSEYLEKDTDNVAKIALKKMFNNEIMSINSKNYDVQYLFNEILKRVKANIGKKILENVINEVYSILKMYSDKLKEGYKFDITANKFKITAIQKRFRKYLNNVYVISDEMLNKDKELFTRYKNAKILIFDEDINSGASLKLTIDAIKDKNDTNDSNLLCLVNAFSDSGW